MSIHHLPERWGQSAQAMGRRKGAVAVGMGIFAAAAVALLPGASSAAPPVPVVVLGGAVAAHGAPETSGPWTVGHPARGSYQLDLGDGWPDVEVTGWDAPTDVVVIPLGRGRVAVRFGGPTPVDTRFTFTAVVEG